jgi:outer membrane lipoprotein SlyB
MTQDIPNMETTPNPASSSSLHPLLWVAGISVTALSLAGVASLTGILPTKLAPIPERPAIVATAPVTAAVVAPVAPVVPIAPPAPPLATPQAPVLPASTALPETHHKKAKKKVEPASPVGPAAMPPPLTSGVPPDYVPAPVAELAPPAPPPCLDCGVISNVREVTHEGKGSGTGAVVGGLAGAVLGSNVGRGNTRTLASIAGAVGGGLLGNSIEKSQTKTVSYQVTVRMEDGTTRMIDSATMPSWRIGDKVKLVGGAIVLR